MQIRRIFVGALCSALSCCAVGGAYAAPKAETTPARSFYGAVKYGQTDSSVGSLSFATKSAQGSKIFDACKMDEFCHVRATVKPGEYTWINRLVKAERVPTQGKPCDLVSFAYSRTTEADRFVVPEDELGQVFSARLVKLIEAAFKRQQTEDSEVSTTPWFIEHDGSPHGVKVVTKPLGDDRAICRATFTNTTDASDMIRKYNFEMTKTADGWRIDDAHIPLRGPGTLVSYANDLAPAKK